jgi:hypothetical protein
MDNLYGGNPPINLPSMRDEQHIPHNSSTSSTLQIMTKDPKKSQNSSGSTTTKVHQHMGTLFRDTIGLQDTFVDPPERTRPVHSHE